MTTSSQIKIFRNFKPSPKVNKMETENCTQLAIAWTTEMSDKLSNAEIDHVSNGSFETDKNNWDPNLVLRERHKTEHQRRVHHIKFLPLPKESVFVEARKLIRKENSEVLTHAKEERMIRRAIHSLEKSFSEYRNSAKFSLIECERLNTRKESTRLAKNGYTLDKSKRMESEAFLKNFQNIYKLSIICQASNIKSEDVVCYRGFDITEKNLKNFEGERRYCPIFRHDGDATHMGVESDGNKVVRPESAESAGSCRYDDEQNKLYPSPKESTSDRDRKREIAAQDSEGSETGRNSNFSHKFKLLRYWKAWRKFVLRTKIDKEKLTRINKIDSFLKRLTKTVRNDNATGPKNFKLCAVKNSNPKAGKPSRKKSIKPVSVTEADKHLDRIEHELNKSAVEAYEHLRRGIKNFHPKLRPKAKVLSTLPKIEKTCHETETKRNYPMPSFLVRMEKRYKERKKRWEDIDRRKREIQSEKEQIEREREEEKMRMEELRKKEKLQELVKRRLERKKAEEERDMRREELRRKIRLAQEHYKKYLTRKMGFEPWRNLVVTRCVQLQEADRHFWTRTRKSHMKHWRNYTVMEIERKCERADKMRDCILLRRSFTLLVNDYNETIKKLQVALDWWDAKLTEKIFKLWLECTRNERWNALRKEEIADYNYNRVIASKYFQKWKKFPEHVRHEREREIRKRLLQRKVQEFLPDYQPACVSEI